MTRKRPSSAPRAGQAEWSREEPRYAELLAAMDRQDAIKDNYLNSFPLGSASLTMAN
jgi:hypothetical protein